MHASMLSEGVPARTHQTTKDISCQTDNRVVSGDVMKNRGVNVERKKDTRRLMKKIHTCTWVSAPPSTSRAGWGGSVPSGAVRERFELRNSERGSSVVVLWLGEELAAIGS